MKQYLLFVFLFLVWTKSTSQTADSKIYVNSDYYYSKTDFTFSDTLINWNYYLTTSVKSIWNDSLAKPIGQITFFRTNPLFDNVNQRSYSKDWTPRIDFEIYNITDSAKCFELAQFTRQVSSCVPPAVGGDIFVIGKFIFLNITVCLRCYDKNMVDYCRPTIKTIFSKVRLDKVSSLKEITQQFSIKESEPK
jgi:hypothetical protein